MRHFRLLSSVALFGLTTCTAIPRFEGYPFQLAGEVHCVEFNPKSKGRILYSFVHSAHSGVFRSDDYGETWRLLSNGFVLDLNGIRLDVKQILCLSSDTSIVLASTSHGIYRSSTSGESWKITAPSLTVLGESIAFHSASNTIYYGQYQDKSVWRSHDKGVTWERQDIGRYELNLCALAVCPKDRNILISGSNNGAISRSADGGHSWTVVYSDTIDSPFLMPPEVPRIVFSLSNPDVVFITRWLSTRSVLRSLDGGRTFAAIVGARFRKAWSLEIDQRSRYQSEGRPLKMWVGNFEHKSADSSIYASFDGGSTWLPQDIPFVSRVWMLKLDTTSSTLAIATSRGLILKKNT